MGALIPLIGGGGGGGQSGSGSDGPLAILPLVLGDRSKLFGGDRRAMSS